MGTKGAHPKSRVGFPRMKSREADLWWQQPSAAGPFHDRSGLLKPISLFRDNARRSLGVVDPRNDWRRRSRSRGNHVVAPHSATEHGKVLNSAACTVPDGKGSHRLERQEISCRREGIPGNRSPFRAWREAPQAHHRQSSPSARSRWLGIYRWPETRSSTKQAMMHGGAGIPPAGVPSLDALSHRCLLGRSR